MKGHIWRADELDLLKVLWRSGVSAHVIGARLGGLSRSAVLGKIFRLRLAAAPSKNKLRARAHMDAAPARRRRSPQRIKLTPAAPVAAPPPPQPVNSVFALTNTSCRWPFGQPGSAQFHFCGAPEADFAGGTPYCAAHMLESRPMLPQEPTFPDSRFHIPWIAYLGSSLLREIVSPPEIQSEPTPDGGLLLIATEDRLDPTNPEHVRHARIIAETMIACTDYQPGGGCVCEVWPPANSVVLVYDVLRQQEDSREPLRYAIAATNSQLTTLCRRSSRMAMCGFC